MRGVYAAVVVWLGLVASGCGQLGSGGYDRYDLGPARQVIIAAVEAIGGLEGWRGVAAVEAWALVTSYNQDGAASIWRQKQLIDLRGGKITAWAKAPQGRWKATVDDSGSCKVKARGFSADERFTSRLGEDLSTILHCARGPMNLLGRGEHALNLRCSKVEGHDVIRVGVLDDDGTPWAYYFDPTSNMLRFVTRGGDRPGEDGTFTTFEYMMTANGLGFPKRIRIVRIGEHILNGGKCVLEVEFSDVEVLRRASLPAIDLPWRGGEK